MINPDREILFKSNEIHTTRPTNPKEGYQW